MKVRIKFILFTIALAGIAGLLWINLDVINTLTFLTTVLASWLYFSERAKHQASGQGVRIAAVFDEVDEPIFVLNQNQQITLMNKAAQKLFKGNWKIQIDRPFVKLLTVDGKRPSSLQELCDSIQNECCLLVDPDKSIPMGISISAHGCTQDLAYTVFVRDISARKFYEELLIDAKDDAEALGNAKTEFLATMSHEIRTPMNGVLGMTQLLLDMELNGEQREAAKIVYSSAESLLTVINDILDYAKIESGKMDLEKTPFNLHVSISEVVELLSRQARAKGIELLVDYDVKAPVGLVGDVGRVRQVILNLLGNALKFTESGHVLVKIHTCSSLIDEALVKISIVDTGIGIASSALPNLFDSFTQADASTTRKFGGTGLGLAISRQLVELMGGEIGVESVPGQGSTFWFTFSAAVEETQSKPMQCVDVSLFENKSALLLDDHAVGLEILTRTFSHLGFSVCGVQSAEMCLRQLESHVFDIVVLDYMMPEMDGEELLRRMSQLSGFDQLITLMLTSTGLLGQKERLLAKGLDGYLLKPLIREDLIIELSRQFDPQNQLMAEEQNQHSEQKQFQLRVLLAEDNRVNQKVAAKMLEKVGCRVDIAANGREAVKMWQDFSYELIFMDCQMPELDGLQATQKIRALEIQQQCARVPIVALTANAMKRDQKACLLAGMDDYVAKPVRQDLLLAAVERWSNVADRVSTDGVR